MLISTSLYWVVIIVFGLVAGAGIVGLQASIKASEGTRRQKMILGAMAVVGVVVVAAVYFSRRSVIVCTEQSGQVSATRKFAIFGLGKGTTWIINRTGHELRVVKRLYGLSFDNPDAVHVPPHSSFAYDDGIEYIGPGNSPPSAIRSDVSIDSRQWLTWDDAH